MMIIMMPWEKCCTQSIAVYGDSYLCGIHAKNVAIVNLFWGTFRSLFEVVQLEKSIIILTDR